MTFGEPRSRSRINTSLASLALVLSVVLWLFVKLTQTPFASSVSQADARVPLEIMKDDGVAALDAPKTVRITVRGSESAIRNLKPNAISAWIDMHGLREGRFLPLVHVSQPPDLSVVAVEPESAPIRLEPVVSEHFPVIARLIGHPATGYIALAPVLRTTMVDVEGPRNLVDRVHEVEAALTLNNNDFGVMQRVLLEPCDDKGRMIGGLVVSPTHEIVTVNIVPAVRPRLLAVFPYIRGTVPSNLRLDVSWSPRFVPVIFSSDAAARGLSLDTQPVDVGALKPGVHHVVVAVRVPAGGTLSHVTQVSVTLHLRKARARRPKNTPPHANSRR